MGLRENILERMKRYNQVMLGGMNGFDGAGEKIGAAKIEELEWVLSELKKGEKSSKVDHEWECEQCCCNECCNKEVNGKKCDCPHHKVSGPKEKNKKITCAWANFFGAGPNCEKETTPTTPLCDQHLIKYTKWKMTGDIPKNWLDEVSEPKEKYKPNSCKLCEKDMGYGEGGLEYAEGYCGMCYDLRPDKDKEKKLDEVSREEKPKEVAGLEEITTVLKTFTRDTPVDWTFEFDIANELYVPGNAVPRGTIARISSQPVFSLEEMASLMEKIDDYFGTAELIEQEDDMSPSELKEWEKLREYYDHSVVDFIRLFKEKPDFVSGIWNEGRSK